MLCSIGSWHQIMEQNSQKAVILVVYFTRLYFRNLQFQATNFPHAGKLGFEHLLELLDELCRNKRLCTKFLLDSHDSFDISWHADRVVPRAGVKCYI